MEVCAEVNVYLVNNIVSFTSYVSNSKNVFILYDLPDPRYRPPVIT